MFKRKLIIPGFESCYFFLERSIGIDRGIFSILLDRGGRFWISPQGNGNIELADFRSLCQSVSGTADGNDEGQPGRVLVIFNVADILDVVLDFVDGVVQIQVKLAFDTRIFDI